MNCVLPQKGWWFVNSGHRVFLVQWLPSWVAFIALTWNSQRVLVYISVFRALAVRSGLCNPSMTVCGTCFARFIEGEGLTLQPSVHITIEHDELSLYHQIYSW